MIVNIGFDSIDTPHGGCTTHFVALLLEKLVSERNIELIDFPNLIRLNPAIPWKTRGNGAVVLRFKVSDEIEAMDLYETALNQLEEYLREYSSDWRQHSDPSIAMYIGEPVEDSVLKWFSEKTLYDYIPLNILDEVLDKLRDRVKYSVFRDKRGLIGCLGSIGYRMINTDYTFELIAYRSSEYIGSERKVSIDSIIEMDKLFSNETILNFDYEVNRPLIIPRGPDPILLGIRGENPDVLLKAFNVLKINEPVPLIVIYRTNQHTDAHLREVSDLREVYPYRSLRVKGIVHTKPKRIIGGHVLFQISDQYRVVDVMVYEPTGGFRNIVEKLEPGDVVEVMGVVRPPSSRHDICINLEKIKVIEVKPKIVYENPMCPNCGSRMTSAGRGKGFKCRKCGFKSRELSKVHGIVKRDLEPGWYEPPARVFKHLMKPIKRLGREKSSFPTLFKPKVFILIK